MPRPWERDWGSTMEQPKVVDMSVYLRCMRRLRGKMEVPPPNFPAKESPDIEEALQRPDEQEAAGDADPEPVA